MLERIFLRPLSATSLAANARALLEQQKNSWEMLARGYESLGRVRTRAIELDDITIKLQFNPGRIVSTGAKVDAKSIAERKCFLCPANLPEAQRAVPFQDDYLVLINPFPIFPEHFTIPHKDHVSQQIKTSFEAMLDLAAVMRPHYTVFYNGPKCGASAPDHLHFQAGSRAFMLVENEYQELKIRHGRAITEADAIRAFAVAHPLRPFIAYESPSPYALLKAFNAFYNAWSSLSGSGDQEPLMNILAGFDAGAWRIILFPRAKHRPSFYFAEGDTKMMLSPASVDIGGVCITPVERDFDRITADHLRQMFRECCLDQPTFGRLADAIARAS